VLETCTILTTMPNSLVAEVHDRMPAILDPDDYERWLDPGNTKPEAILDCLRPFDVSLMRKYPVSPRVNRTKTTMRSVPEKYQRRTRRRHCSDFIERQESVRIFSKVTLRSHKILAA
jgi:putative SOS response-associated peptidase YedK